ncbi:hypothetical protein N9O57_00140 [bacterium]|nr:hypothetical protein [bacterium]
MTSSKRLFRCATAKERKSKLFAGSSSKQTALEKFLNNHTESTNPIDATFSRSLPVQKGHMSRFVPTGYSSHASYFSEDKEVTFYEYLFHVITHTHSKGSIFKLAIFIADINFRDGKKKNINRLQPKKKKLILDPNTYEHSHEYINNLDSVPSSITYRSVRASKDINNHAIYNINDIFNISKDLTPILAKVIKSSGSHYNVELDMNSHTQIIEIEKKHPHL